MVILTLSLVISSSEVSLVFIQHDNARDPGDNGAVHLCYLMMEGLLLIFLIFGLIIFSDGDVV